MSDDDEDIEVLSEARGFSLHAGVESWGASEQQRRKRQELAGVGRLAAAKELQKRESDRSIITTAAIAFGCTFAMLFTASITIDHTCRRAMEGDYYSKTSQFCRSHSLPRHLN
ncbi:MAG: hypothetical protein AAFR11_03365 [Pseudomonadota bacterium]